MITARERAPARRLFWRVYLYGLALVAGLLAIGAIVFLASGTPPWWDCPTRLATVLADRIDADGSDRAGIVSLLDDVHRIVPTDVAVYDARGRLIAAAGTPPPPLEASDLRGAGFALRGLAIDRGERLTGGIADGGQVVLRFEGRIGRFGVLALLALLLLTLAPYPFARAIARPLEQLTASARRIGAGELSTRSGLERRDEIGELGRAFDEMATRVEQMLLAEKELLANVSHEIRTPLSRIRLALALGQEGGAEADLRRRLTDIAQDAAELEELVDNVLLAARCEAVSTNLTSGLELRREPLVVADVIEEAAVLFTELAPDSLLELNVDPDLPELAADRGLLRRLLKNLLENAAKYSEPGAPIELAARLHGSALELRVDDRGIGVAAEDLPRLFEPFFRTDRSRDRGTGGFGMGLTVCRRIVEAHGGTIEAAQRDGGGLTVRVTIPVPSTR